jgi:hypothetical protein
MKFSTKKCPDKPNGEGSLAWWSYEKVRTQTQNLKLKEYRYSTKGSHFQIKS